MHHKKTKFSFASLLLATMLGLPWSLTAFERFKGSAALVERVGLRPAQGCLVSPNQELPPRNAWHGLVPLRSTRSDVERVLGKAELSHGLTFIYRTKDERVDVLYSAGPCKLSGVERWQVPQDVIIRIVISPVRNIPLKELGLDQRKYLRMQRRHPANWVDYVNREDGVVFRAVISGESEEVDLITYEPSAKDKTRRCRNQ